MGQKAHNGFKLAISLERWSAVTPVRWKTAVNLLVQLEERRETPNTTISNNNEYLSLTKSCRGRHSQHKVRLVFNGGSQCSSLETKHHHWQALMRSLNFALYCEQESFHRTDNHFLLSTQIDAVVHILYTQPTPTLSLAFIPIPHKKSFISTTLFLKVKAMNVIHKGRFTQMLVWCSLYIRFLQREFYSFIVGYGYFNTIQVYVSCKNLCIQVNMILNQFGQNGANSKSVSKLGRYSRLEIPTSYRYLIGSMILIPTGWFFDITTDVGH